MEAEQVADTGRMCLHTPGCSRNTGTLLSGRLELNKRGGVGGGGQGREQIQAECAFILVVPKTKELFCRVG